MGKIQGANLEVVLTKWRYKNKCVAFRAPGSGTYKVEETPIPYSDLQKKCKIEITGIGFIDFGYDPYGYQTADYSGFFIGEDSSPIQSQGNHSDYEFRFVELKTVRLRKSHLKKGETKKDVNKKEHKMKETFNLLQKDHRSTIKREINGEKKTITNPYKGKWRKSDFCMELQRTWYMALLMRENVKDMMGSIGIEVNTEELPIHGYLQVRFMSTYSEIWIKISDLAFYGDSTLSFPRDSDHTMLDIIKDEDNTITWKWRLNKRL